VLINWNKVIDSFSGTSNSYCILLNHSDKNKGKIQELLIIMLPNQNKINIIHKNKNDININLIIIFNIIFF